MVAWMSYWQHASANRIHDPSYGADGNVSGDEFQINTYTSIDQSDPSVTSLADGGFVVTWASDDQDGSQWGIYGQRYGADGNASGDEFRINTYTSNKQQSPSVTLLADGGFVVNLMSYLQA